MLQPLTFRRRVPALPAAATMDADAAASEARARTAGLPRVAWIELTSRCPYDCPFCSRRALRGHGVNMDFALYRRLIAELERPEIIRLNYAGESAHHPRIVDAIALAAGTGAWVELVSVPAAVAPQRLNEMIHAGLNRLTVSLHTLDPERYDGIYRFGSLAALLAGVRAAAALRSRTAHPFVVDFAFVAMQRNLDQLPAVAALATELAIPVLAVHPVIRRDEIAEKFAAELDAEGRVRPGFAAQLDAALAATRAANPGVAIQVSAPAATDAAPPADNRVAYWPAPLADGLRIHGCDQDPFETVHVLADGTVVSCEVRDRQPLGSLASTTLAEIWHGEASTAFRIRHAAGQDPACRTCEYKKVYRPGPLATRVTPAHATSQLLRGWHAPEATLVWSKRDALLTLARPATARVVVVRGMLPPATGGANVLRLRAGAGEGVAVENAGTQMIPVEARLPLPGRNSAEPQVYVRCEVRHAHRPACGGRLDARELGFALLEAEAR